MSADSCTATRDRRVEIYLASVRSHRANSLRERHASPFRLVATHLDPREKQMAGFKLVLPLLAALHNGQIDGRRKSPRKR